MLVKHAIVAKLHPQQDSQRHMYFQYGPDGDERREGVYLTRKNWDEMGQPEEITVRIEAGNQLEDVEREENFLDKIPSRMPQVPLTFAHQEPDVQL